MDPQTDKEHTPSLRRYYSFVLRPENIRSLPHSLHAIGTKYDRASSPVDIQENVSHCASARRTASDKKVSD